MPDELRLRMFQIPVEASFLSPEEDAAFTETLLQKLKK